MNKISFKGSTAIIKDFASLFLPGEGVRANAGDDMRAKFEGALGDVARAKAVDPDDLWNAVAFLAAHGMSEKRIARLLEERPGHLAGLAADVSILRAYRKNGTIVSVRVVEERADDTLTGPSG